MMFMDHIHIFFRSRWAARWQSIARALGSRHPSCWEAFAGAKMWLLSPLLYDALASGGTQQRCPSWVFFDNVWILCVVRTTWRNHASPNIMLKGQTQNEHEGTVNAETFTFNYVYDLFQSNHFDVFWCIPCFMSFPLLASTVSTPWEALETNFEWLLSLGGFHVAWLSPRII